MNHYQDLSKFYMPKGFRGKNAFVVQLWWLVDALFFRPSPQIFYGWRRFLLRCFGAQIGKQVIIRPSAKITYPWNITIGDYTWIGDQVELYSLGVINIGSHSVISQKSYICAGSHKYEQLDFEIFSLPVNIGNEVWIATDVFVAPGVDIGNGALVGARSTVLKSIEGGFVYAGNPLKKIKPREIVKS